MDVDWQKLGHEQKFKYLLRGGHLADVSFVIGETPDDLKTFPCHKLILTCASPVFERMFYGDFKESHSSRIHLDDVDPINFDRFLEFIYCNNNSALKIYSLDSLKSLITLGDRYMVESIKAAAIETIAGRISTCDIVDLVTAFEIGRLFDETRLTLQSVDVIESRIASDGLSALAVCSRIYDLNPGSFYTLLDQLTGIMDRERFDLIETYVKVNGLLDAAIEEEQPIVMLTNPPNQLNPNQSTVVPKETEAKKSLDSEAAKEGNQSKAVDDKGQAVDHKVVRNDDVVKMLLILVNFQNMSAKEFSDGPAKSQLLDTAKKLEILMACTE